MSDFIMNGMYLGQSGFFLEFPSATLIFDWVYGTLPSVRNDKPLYIFISHIHNDHFKQDIFSLKQKYPKAEFFLGYDRDIPEINTMLDSLPDSVQDALSCFQGEQKLYSDDGMVLIRTFTSTDLGVAFLVEIEGKKIYHAGDLFLMKNQTREEYTQMYTIALMTGRIMPTYEESLKNAEREFIERTEPLRGIKVDYGILPLDSRIENTGFETIKRYMEVMTFEAWSPMHLWGKYDFVDTFLKSHPEYISNIVAISQNANVK